MAESARKKQRVTPRDSEGAASGDERTLYADLHQLAGAIRKPSTPYRRASSAGPTPRSGRTPSILIRTPGTAARTPRDRLATRPTPTRRAAPTTPHALRALRERANAARTPGRIRRRSANLQRDTPRDTLRALSRTLARQAPAIEPSPDGQIRPGRNSALDLPDVEDGPDPVVPRLSMPLDDMYEDDSFQEAPPRQSLLPDLPDDVDTGTMHSLEFGRRAHSEDPRMALAARLSERFADVNELGMDGEEYEIDGTFINRRRSIVDPDQFFREAIEQTLEDTGEIQALTGRRDGRPSDVDLGVFGEEDEPDEPTFRFTIPQRIRPSAEDEQVDPALFVQDMDEETSVQADQDDGLDILAPDDATGEFDGPGWESDRDAEGDIDLQAYREEVPAVDRSMLHPQSPEPAGEARGGPRRQRREMRTSKAGHDYPSFPPAVVKRLANGLARSQGGNAKISKDTLVALVQATDWFFEQMGEDLAAYAQHAGRKMIEDRDVIALMKRQRQITNKSTSFSLAQKMLPRELLQELRMEPVQKLKGQKRKRMRTIPEEEEAD